MNTDTAKFFSPRLSWLWLGAFICAMYPLKDYQLELFSGAVVLIFTWAYLMFARGVDAGWSVPRAPVLIFGGLFWLLVFASVGWSDVKSVSLLGLCFFSFFPLTFFAGVLNGRADDFKWLAKTLAVLYGVLAAWAVFQFFFMNVYFHGQARHPLADPSSLGALFSLGLFCALGAVLANRPKRQHIAAIVLSVLLVCGIMATVARGPVFGFIPGIIVFAILLWPQIKLRWRSMLVIVLGGALFFGLMQTGVQKKYDLGKRVFGTVTLQMDNVGNNRPSIWSSAIDIIKEHPLTGTGIGTFFLNYPEHRRATEADGVFLAHNDPLQFWTELGVLGPLLFYAFVIAAAMRTFAALKKMQGPEMLTDKIMTVSIFGGLTAMVAHSHVSFNHYNLTILMVAGLLLAVWFHVTGRALQEENRTIVAGQASRGLYKALLALPFLMIGWLAMSISAGEYFVNKARDDLFNQEMFHFADNINQANRVSMGLNYRAYLLAVSVPMVILEMDKPKPAIDHQKNLYEQVVGYMDTVTALNPHDSSAPFYLGKVQELVDKEVIPENTPPPEEYFEKALKLDPTHLGARLSLYTRYKYQEKSVEEQIAVLEKGLPYTYTTPVAMDFYATTARAYLESGNYGKVKGVMAKMAEFKERSDFSLKRQNTSLPQAIMGGDDIFTKPGSFSTPLPDLPPESTGKTGDGM